MGDLGISSCSFVAHVLRTISRIQNKRHGAVDAYAYYLYRLSAGKIMAAVFGTSEVFLIYKGPIPKYKINELGRFAVFCL